MTLVAWIAPGWLITGLLIWAVVEAIGALAGWLA